MNKPQVKSTQTPASHTGEETLTVNYRPLLIKSKEAARLLGIGERTLWSLSRRNAIPSHRIGQSVRYCPSELQAWIKLGCPLKPDSATKVRDSMECGVAS